MKSSIFFLLFLFLTAPLHATVYSGRIFIDKNASNTFDKGDTPIQGVVVTDGQNVTKTDREGKFSLPGYEKTRFITITTPSGYQASRYYIPVNPSVKSYEFILTSNKRLQNEQHSFIQITDTEIFSRGIDTQWPRYLKEYIQNEAVSFLIHTGDICYESGLREHIKVVNSETMHCPVYYCIGNHDLVKGEYGEQLFESIYGPTWYSFDAGNVHYVVTPMASGDHRPSYTKDEVLRWLRNDLAMMQNGKQLVVFNHDILTTSDDFFFGPGKHEYIDLRPYHLKAWIYGHWHYNYVRNQKGIYTVCTAPLDKGGIDHSASAFRVFQMEKDGVADIRLHYCFMEHQAVIVAPANGSIAPMLASGKIPLSVNAYHSGSEVQQVSYTIKNGSNTSMPQQMARQSDWNWYAEFTPGTSTEQLLEVSITATYSDGHTIISHSTFTYRPNLKTSIKPDKNWTNLLGNVAHTGIPSSTLRQPLRVAWVTNLNANIFMASPLIIGNTVFVATADDNTIRHAGVCALDIHTGRLLWKCSTRNSIKNSIAYDRETVFAQDAEGYLYAIDARSGALRWEQKIIASEFPYLEEGLIADNGVVYAGTGKDLGAFRAEDGTPLWKNAEWGKNEAATTTLTIGKNVLTAGTQWGALYGHNAQTGGLLWKLSENGLSSRGASTTLHDGNFYVISKNSFFIIEPQSGIILKRKELSEFNLDVTSTPLISDSEIIFGTADKGIVALDKETLDIKWNTPTRQSLFYTAPYSTVPFASVETSPVLSNGIIYFGASDGYLYGLKSGNGEIVWKVNTGAPVLASVAISGNVLLAVDYSGNVCAYVSQ